MILVNIFLVAMLFGTMLHDAISTITPEAASTTTPISDADNPIPFGDVVRVGDYDVTVLNLTPDAKDEIEKANESAIPADNDQRFAMVRVQITYIGDETGDPFIDLSFHAITESGQEYSRHEPYGCGRIPDQQIEVGELAPGDSAGFNVCWAIDPADGDPVTMIAVPAFADTTTIQWLSLVP